ncbi:hypothetical protein BJV78DRAFT_680818 [Lactifluus subvellereus]|nr:hypothetical protein BJV78DRAFT_680818 [Lactifluus subvellereus]
MSCASIIHIWLYLCVHEASQINTANLLSPTKSSQREPAPYNLPYVPHSPHDTSSSSNFRSIFDAALKDYQKKTKNDLLAHQLTAELKSCESATAILAVLNKKYHVQHFIRSQTDRDSSKQWLNATLTVLCAFSAALGEGVGLVFSPAKVIFAGVGVLLIAAKDVDASQDVLVDLFTRIETFSNALRRMLKCDCLMG